MGEDDGVKERRWELYSEKRENRLSGDERSSAVLDLGLVSWVCIVEAKI